MNNKIYGAINFRIFVHFRDDEEWLANRKVMNAMLLRNDFQLAHTVIENVSEDLIAEWNRKIKTADNFTQVTELMAGLYTWAIKGTLKDICVVNLKSYSRK